MRTMRKFTIALVLTVFMTALFAQKTDVTTRACFDAKLDVRKDVNTILWLGAGCLFSILGVGAAYVIKPSPPASRLLGKSSDYVAAYTNCYRHEGRKLQTRAAAVGCVSGASAAVALYPLLIEFEIIRAIEKALESM